MGMHTEQCFSFFRNFLFKNPIKILEISGRHDILLKEPNEQIRFLERIRHNDDKSFDGDDLTVESDQCIQRNANDEEEGQLEE